MPACASAAQAVPKLLCLAVSMELGNLEHEGGRWGKPVAAGCLGFMGRLGFVKARLRACLHGPFLRIRACARRLEAQLSCCILIRAIGWGSGVRLSVSEGGNQEIVVGSAVRCAVQLRTPQGVCPAERAQELPTAQPQTRSSSLVSIGPVPCNWTAGEGGEA